MKTPEQRVIEIIGYRLGITPFFAEEIAKEILEALTEPEDDIPAGYKCAKCKKRLSECTCTAHTEPEDERKRFPKGKPSSMEDIFMEYPHTEPEDENQITLRKIEEFCQSEYASYPPAGINAELQEFADWLQEDK